MKAPKRVVVGVDGSNESAEAIQTPPQYAASTGAVVEAWTSWTFPALSGIAYDVSNWEANARETLEIALARALPNGSCADSRRRGRGCRGRRSPRAWRFRRHAAGLCQPTRRSTCNLSGGCRAPHP